MPEIDYEELKERARRRGELGIINSNEEEHSMFGLSGEALLNSSLYKPFSPYDMHDPEKSRAISNYYSAIEHKIRELSDNQYAELNKVKDHFGEAQAKKIEEDGRRLNAMYDYAEKNNIVLDVDKEHSRLDQERNAFYMKKLQHDVNYLDSTENKIVDYLRRVDDPDNKIILQPEEAHAYSKDLGLELKFDKPVSKAIVTQRVEREKLRNDLNKEIEFYAQTADYDTRQSLAVGMSAMSGSITALDLALFAGTSYALEATAPVALARLGQAGSILLKGNSIFKGVKAAQKVQAATALAGTYANTAKKAQLIADSIKKEDFLTKFAYDSYRAGKHIRDAKTMGSLPSTATYFAIDGMVSDLPRTTVQYLDSIAMDDNRYSLKNMLGELTISGAMGGGFYFAGKGIAKGASAIGNATGKGIGMAGKAVIESTPVKMMANAVNSNLDKKYFGKAVEEALRGKEAEAERLMKEGLNAKEVFSKIFDEIGQEYGVNAGIVEEAMNMMTQNITDDEMATVMALLTDSMQNGTPFFARLEALPFKYKFYTGIPGILDDMNLLATKADITPEVFLKYLDERGIKLVTKNSTVVAEASSNKFSDLLSEAYTTMKNQLKIVSSKVSGDKGALASNAVTALTSADANNFLAKIYISHLLDGTDIGKVMRESASKDLDRLARFQQGLREMISVYDEIARANAEVTTIRYRDQLYMYPLEKGSNGSLRDKMKELSLYLLPRELYDNYLNATKVIEKDLMNEGFVSSAQAIDPNYVKAAQTFIKQIEKFQDDFVKEFGIEVESKSGKYTFLNLKDLNELAGAERTAVRGEKEDTRFFNQLADQLEDVINKNTELLNTEKTFEEMQLPADQLKDLMEGKVDLSELGFSYGKNMPTAIDMAERLTSNKEVFEKLAENRIKLSELSNSDAFLSMNQILDIMHKEVGSDATRLNNLFMDRQLKAIQISDHLFKNFNWDGFRNDVMVKFQNEGIVKALISRGVENLAGKTAAEQIKTLSATFRRSVKETLLESLKKDNVVDVGYFFDNQFDEAIDDVVDAFIKELSEAPDDALKAIANRNTMQSSVTTLSEESQKVLKTYQNNSGILKTDYATAPEQLENQFDDMLENYHGLQEDIENTKSSISDLNGQIDSLEKEYEASKVATKSDKQKIIKSIGLRDLKNKINKCKKTYKNIIERRKNENGEYRTYIVDSTARKFKNTMHMVNEKISSITKDIKYYLEYPEKLDKILNEATRELNTFSGIPRSEEELKAGGKLSKEMTNAFLKPLKDAIRITKRSAQNLQKTKDEVWKTVKGNKDIHNELEKLYAEKESLTSTLDDLTTQSENMSKQMADLSNKIDKTVSKRTAKQTDFLAKLKALPEDQQAALVQEFQNTDINKVITAYNKLVEQIATKDTPKLQEKLAAAKETLAKFDIEADGTTPLEPIGSNEERRIAEMVEGAKALIEQKQKLNELMSPLFDNLVVASANMQNRAIHSLGLMEGYWKEILDNPTQASEILKKFVSDTIMPVEGSGTSLENLNRVNLYHTQFLQRLDNLGLKEWAMDKHNFSDIMKSCVQRIAVLKGTASDMEKLAIDENSNATRVAMAFFDTAAGMQAEFADYSANKLAQNIVNIFDSSKVSSLPKRIPIVSWGESFYQDIQGIMNLTDSKYDDFKKVLSPLLQNPDREIEGNQHAILYLFQRLDLDEHFNKHQNFSLGLNELRDHIINASASNGILSAIEKYGEKKVIATLNKTLNGLKGLVESLPNSGTNIADDYKNMSISCFEDMKPRLHFKSMETIEEVMPYLAYDDYKSFFEGTLGRANTSLNVIKKFGGEPFQMMNSLIEMSKTYAHKVLPSSDMDAKTVRLIQEHVDNPALRNKVHFSLKSITGGFEKPHNIAVRLASSLIRALSAPLLTGAGVKSLTDYNYQYQYAVNMGLMSGMSLEDRAQIYGNMINWIRSKQTCQDLYLNSMIRAESMYKMFDPSLGIGNTWLGGFNRYAEGIDKFEAFSSKVSDALLNKIGWIEPLTNYNRANAAQVVVRSIGNLKGTKFAQLNEYFQRTLNRYGITPEEWDDVFSDFAIHNGNDYINRFQQMEHHPLADFNIFAPDTVLDLSDEQIATLMQKQGKKLITPRTVRMYRNELANKAGTLVNTAADEMTSIPNSRIQGLLLGGYNPRSAEGVILNSITQFKSFGAAVTFYQYGRRLAQHIADNPELMNTPGIWSSIEAAVFGGSPSTATNMWGMIVESAIVQTLLNEALNQTSDNPQGWFTESGEFNKEKLWDPFRESADTTGIFLDTFNNMFQKGKGGGSSLSLQVFPVGSTAMKLITRVTSAATKDATAGNRGQAIAGAVGQDVMDLMGIYRNPLFKQVLGLSVMDKLKEWQLGDEYIPYLKSRVRNGYGPSWLKRMFGMDLFDSLY